ncbi:MAG: CdaR family protein [Anaerolineae bacterium]|jgi:YbbR domain-containing protein|nr:CdaR family protein [Anaerolineae bacterium]
MQSTASSSLTSNILWFLASLALAFLVWVIATTQSDPIAQRRLTGITIQMQPDEGMIVTLVAGGRRTANVNVRARQSVLQLLTNDDVTLHADLAGLSPGVHTVPLRADVSEARRAVVDPQPAQITITLEQEQRELKPVVVEILNEPPEAYSRGEIQISETQVLVTGVATRVREVQRLQAILDLSQQRTTFSSEIELVPVDAAGNRVADVSIAQTVRVTVEITQREDVEVISVIPSIDRESLGEAYIYLGLIDWNPKSISVTGSDQALAELGETLQTETIDLANATGPLTVNIPVQLPQGVFLVESDQTIEVEIAIEVREDIKPLDAIPVQWVGLGANLTVTTVPETVTVLVQGPQPIVEQLTADNIRVEINLQGLGPGTHNLTPIATTNIGQIPSDTISILPTTISVTLTAIGEPP